MLRSRSELSLAVSGRPWLDRPVEEPDLAAWAWHRATGAAAAVGTAAVAGAVLGSGDALVAAVAAAGVVYVVGPILAALERRVLRQGPVTPRRLRRTWAALAVGALWAVAVALGGDGTDLVVALIGTPIALPAVWGAVHAGLRLPAHVGRPLALAVPTVVVVAATVAAAHVSLVDAALVLAVLVVVPAAIPLVPGAPTAAPLVALAGAGPATGALLLSPADGPLAAWLTAPWVVVCSAGAVLTGWRWWTGGQRARDAVWPAACGYLAVGSWWLLADRAASQPAGVGPPFVELTAVHFTYAGFVATVLAARAWQWLPADRVAVAAVLATVGAPPLVAVGFVAVGALQVVGAVTLTVGTYALAWVTLQHVVPTVRPVTAWALALSSLSVLVPMLLAVQWAVGVNLDTPALSVPQMAATHGVANAVGFALLGVLGWRLVSHEGRALTTDDGGHG